MAALKAGGCSSQQQLLSCISFPWQRRDTQRGPRSVWNKDTRPRASLGVISTGISVLTEEGRHAVGRGRQF